MDVCSDRKITSPLFRKAISVAEPAVSFQITILKVLADRYALGEIGAEELSERVAALRKASETPEQRKERLERDARTLRKKIS